MMVHSIGRKGLYAHAEPETPSSVYGPTSAGRTAKRAQSGIKASWLADSSATPVAERRTDMAVTHGTVLECPSLGEFVPDSHLAHGLSSEPYPKLGSTTVPGQIMCDGIHKSVQRAYAPSHRLMQCSSTLHAACPCDVLIHGHKEPSSSRESSLAPCHNYRQARPRSRNKVCWTHTPHRGLTRPNRSARKNSKVDMSR